MWPQRRHVCDSRSLGRAAVDAAGLCPGLARSHPPRPQGEHSLQPPPHCPHPRRFSVPDRERDPSFTVHVCRAQRLRGPWWLALDSHPRGMHAFAQILNEGTEAPRGYVTRPASHSRGWQNPEENPDLVILGQVAHGARWVSAAPSDSGLLCPEHGPVCLPRRLI